MPFTVSHAVVALPFVRTPLIPAAIAIGAMTPDLPLFVRMLVPSYARTHDLAWLPVTILLALALLLVWRCVLRPASRALVPAFIAERLPSEWDAGAAAALRETFGIVPVEGRVTSTSTSTGTDTRTRTRWHGSFRAIALLVISLALGVATHIAWDLFTHEGRIGTDLIPILDQMWGPLAGFKWLQHGSSVLGLLILAIWGAYWLAAHPRTPHLPRVAGWVRVSWWISLPVLLLGAWLWGMTAFGPFTSEWTVQHLAYRVPPPASAAFGILTLALCIAVQLASRRNQRDAR